jgi:hypothetical protein
MPKAELEMHCDATPNSPGYSSRSGWPIRTVRKNLLDGHEQSLKDTYGSRAARRPLSTTKIVGFQGLLPFWRCDLNVAAEVESL